MTGRNAVVLALALLGLAAVLVGASSNVPSVEEQQAFQAAQAAQPADACRELTKFILKYPGTSLMRDARLRRSSACLDAGSWENTLQPIEELHQLADSGPEDWVRAQALDKLVKRGDWQIGNDYEARGKLALDVCAALVRGKGPQAGQALERLAEMVIEDLHNGRLGDPEPLAARALAFDLAPAVKAHIVFERALRLLGDAKRGEQAEKDLAAIANGPTEFADDAFYRLGELAESRAQYPHALELYARSAALHGNMSSDAANRTESIKRPSLSVGVSYIELPGSHPEATVSFRNLREATLTLRRLDPVSAEAKAYFDHGGPGSGKRSEPLRTWKVDLKEPAPFAPSSRSVTLETAFPGVYVLEAHSGEQSSETLLHVTPYACVVKSSVGEVLVWTTDAMTGEAVPKPHATLFVEGTDSSNSKTIYSKLETDCDALGLCRFQVPERLSYADVWISKGGAYTYARGSSSYWGSYNREVLGYLLTDRPLYKPNEKVGVKLFLRTRGQGPAAAVPNRHLRVTTHDASGNQIDKHELTTSAFGTASFEVQLKKDAPLGQYRFSVEDLAEKDRIYVQQGGQGFRVEEYKPPEFTVSVEPVGKPVPGEPVKVRVSASLFAGGPIAYAEGRALVMPRYWQHAFGRWPDEPEDAQDYYGYGYGYRGYGRGRYVDYGDEEPALERPVPTRPGAAVPKPCFQWQQRTVTFKTGEDGTAVIEVEPGCKDAADHALDVQVLLTDLSRREVTGSGSVNVSAVGWFVDLKTDHFLYRPGEKVGVKLRAEDANARPESPQVQLRLVRVDDKDPAEVLRKDVTVEKGSFVASLDADAIGPVRVEVRRQGADPKTEPALASADLWLTSETRPIIPPWDGLFVLTDQRPLQAGTSMRALLVTPHAGGHALVSLEGDKLHLAQVVELKGRARFVELPLTGAMTPHVQLSVARFERLTYQAWSNQMRVAGSENQIDVQVKAPAASALPGAVLPVEVKLSGVPAKTPAEIAFTAVDEAVFTIQPEPKDFVSFYARQYQQNRVQTNVSTNFGSFHPLPPEPPRADGSKPLPAYVQAAPMSPSRASYNEDSSEREAAPSAPAGAADLAPAKMNRGEAAGPAASSAPSPVRAQAPTPPPVRVRSNFASSGGWLPEIKGTLGGTAKAQAHFSDSLTSWKLTAYAVTASGHLGVGSTTVRTEQPLMVRLQGPRFFTERDEVVLSAVVTSRLAHATSVEVSFDVPGLKPLGPTKKKVTVGPNRDTRVDVRYAVNAVGNQRFRATARAGEAADAMEWTLPAIVHGVPKRTAFTGTLKERFGFDLNLPEKRNPKGTQLALIVSPSLLGVMLDALPYLANYPYGCVEQTLSRFVPAVAAQQVVQKFGAPAGRVPAELPQMIDAGLKRLYGFEHSDGGWGWWQTDSSDPRMTAYVVWGLTLAKNAGVKVEQGAIDRGRGWLLARTDRELSADDQAFVSFALASSGEVPKKSLDQAYDKRSAMSERGRAFVSLALATAKDARAKDALASLSSLFDVIRLGIEGRQVEEVWDTCAGIETTALALMAANRRDPSDPLVKTLTDFLVLRRKGDHWSTTRDTAFAIYALADVALQTRGEASDGKIRVMVNGAEAAKVAYHSGGADLKTILLGDSAFKLGANHVEVIHDGKVTGHWAALFDIFDVDENVKAHPNQAVEIKRTYTVLGRPGGEKVAASMEYGMMVESGERVRVDIDLVVAKPIEYVMIEDLKAAGLEPVVQRSGPEVCGYQCTHAELKTDRVAIFARELAPGTHHFSYETRAEVPGRFHGLPTRVEAMYAPEIRATSDEMRIEVRDAPKTGEGVANQ
jgi:uncharacterized protein YfaS (alpha-2-macroglobulin family)